MGKLFKSVYRKTLLWIMQGRIYSKLLYKVIPYIRFTTYYTRFSGKQYFNGYALLQPGDILVSTDKKKLSNLIIPGEWSHAALFLGKGTAWELSEMTHTDYTKSHFFDFCKTSERIGILRCKDWDKSYIESQVIPMCKSLEHAKYDVEFALGVESLYCSELIYVSDLEKRLQVNLDDLAGLGREYISPTGLAKGKNLEWIYDSNWDKQP